MEMRPPAPGETTVIRDGEWPTETGVLPPAPPPPPAAPPPGEDPGNRIGLGMLLAIVLLAAAGAVLAAVLLTRDRNHPAATPTTVVVTTTAVPTTSTPATTARSTKKPKKLILPVPDLIGQQWKDAAAGLRRAGFHVSIATVPSALPRGAVTAQDPKAGTKVAKGSDVRLNVSNGVEHQAGTSTATTPASTPAQTNTAQATAQVPSLSGDLRSVLQQLDQAGFVASIAYVPATQPLGTVVAQSPSGGASAQSGSQVTINVSSGPNGTADQTVPTVVGQRIPQALGTLHGSGLRLILLRARVSDRSKAGV